MSKSIVGIDLGTTMSALAYLHRSGEPSISVNDQGERLTPSVLYCPPRENRIEVGQRAVAMQQMEHQWVLREVKRHMHSSEPLKVGNRNFLPAEASALILKKLIQDAEGECGKIESAVVTVPANFAEEARRATIRAGELAGIQVKHIINEPTAAALYYSHASKISGTTLIFDLGGGTFDATIAEIQGQAVRVLTSEGDKHLGGSDFDRCLFNLIQERFRDKTGTDLLGDGDAYDQYQTDVENLKKMLSFKDSHPISLARTSGESAMLMVSRSDFEQSIAKFIDKAMICVETALDSAKLRPQDIQQVLLVGGSTRIPIVQSTLTRLFGKPPVQKGNVDEAVALGACVYAGLKAPSADLTPLQRAALSATAVRDVTNHYYGTLSLNERGVLSNSIILKKDMPIPCENTEEYQTVANGQEQILCRVTQSAYPEMDADMVKVVHEAVMRLPPNRPAGRAIKVKYSYDANQLMHCTFIDVESGITYEHKIKVEADATHSSTVQGLIVE